MTSKAVLQRRDWLLLAASCVVQAVMFAIIARRNAPWINSDSEQYIALAMSLFDEHRFGWTEAGAWQPEGWRLPGYPAFVAAIWKLSNHSDAAVIIVQGVLAIASTVVVWRWALNALGLNVARWFLVITLGYPFLLNGSSWLSAEACTAFLTAIVVAWLSSSAMPRVSVMLMAGVVFGLTSLFRPTNLPMGVMIAMAMAFFTKQRKGSAAFALGVVLAGIPYTVYNKVTFDRWSPLPVIQGGAGNLYVSAWSSVLDTDSLLELGRTGTPDEAIIKSGLLDEIKNVRVSLGVEPIGYCITPPCFPGNELKIKAEQAFGALARAHIREWFVPYALRSTLNIFRNWYSWDSPSVPFIVVLALRIVGVVAAALGFVGLWLSRKRLTAPSTAFAWSLVVITALVHAPYYTEARYTLAARLELLVFAAFTLDWLVARRWRSRPVTQAGFEPLQTAS